MPSRILWALFVAYLAATALHIGFVIAHEPFSFDAWNVAVDTGAQPPSLGRFFDYWQHQYAHSNPRLGQALTYVVYKVDWFAEIATPIAYLALTLAVTVLGLGRWPKRGREVALWAIVVGFGWFAFPELGRNMFSRAYSANYVYAAAIQLWFLAWLRLGLAKPPTTARLAEYAMFGLIAGVCNEHTGPTLVTFLVGVAWWLRRGGSSPRIPIAAAFGASIGVAALLLAPGQAERYDGLGQRAGLIERVTDRGAGGNLGIFLDYLLYAAPVVALALLVWMLSRSPEKRRALSLLVLVVTGGLAIVATVCASPKLGSRFYIVPLALLVAGLVALLDTIDARRLVPFVVAGVAASTYAAIRTVPLFAGIAEQGAARMAVLERSAPGSVLLVDTWDQVEESWWFIGDDFRDVKKRELVARYFALDRVSLRGGESKTALPALGIRVVPRYRLRGATSVGATSLGATSLGATSLGATSLGATSMMPDKTFDLGTTASNLPDLHRATRAALERLPALDRFELGVEFDIRPMLVRRTLLSRWKTGRFEGYAAAVEPTHVELPPDLVGKAFDIYLVQPGERPTKLGSADRARFEHARIDGAWVVACDAAECLIIGR